MIKAKVRVVVLTSLRLLALPMLPVVLVLVDRKQPGPGAAGTAEAKSLILARRDEFGLCPALVPVMAPALTLVLVVVLNLAVNVDVDVDVGVGVGLEMALLLWLLLWPLWLLSNWPESSFFLLLSSSVLWNQPKALGMLQRRRARARWGRWFVVV
jgi:hypothetical protein